MILSKRVIEMSDNIDKVYLAKIVEATDANQQVFVGQAMGQPMLAHNPPLIEINPGVTNPDDPTQVLCRSTSAAKEYLASANTTTHVEAKPAATSYTIIKNVEIPAAKRRGNPSGNGAPAKYPFDSMEVGDTFFSADTEHKKGNAVKALGSSISAQNKKYSKETGETKTVTRAIRDKKTHKAVLNADGTKQTETVQLPKLEYERKFTVRPVEKGVQYGSWTAPENGALVARVK